MDYLKQLEMFIDDSANQAAQGLIAEEQKEYEKRQKMLQKSKKEKE